MGTGWQGVFTITPFPENQLFHGIVPEPEFAISPPGRRLLERNRIDLSPSLIKSSRRIENPV
jgi:hypothetical protein